MNDHACNPFSTRFTRPGALPFHFDQGEDISNIVARLRQQNWFGQIIGPHGSGKSTLVATLRPALEAAGRDLQLVQLQQIVGRLGRAKGLFSGRRSLEKLAWRRFSAATQVIIDGYERLGPLARWLVVARCRRRGCGLLVTTHHDSGLPTIYTMQPRLELALALVRRLLPTTDVIGQDDVESAWQIHHGNLREVLFSLYDLFEERRPPGG